MQQYEVSFLPEDKRITVAEDVSLLQAARATGLIVEAPCDGKGTCGKCRIRATGALSSPDALEAARLGDALAADIRLACRAKICGSVQAEILSDPGETFVALTEGQSGRWPFDPPSRKMNDRHCQSGQPHYGVALDIGTTSVVAELFDLGDGKSLGIQSCLNPQTEFGGDVLTRIAFTSEHDDGTKLLQQKIVGCINHLLDQLVAARKLRREDIYEIVVAGNTTMQHLLMGISPRSLAQAPYRPIFTEQLEVRPAEVGLNVAPSAVVTVLPSAAAFVGADIVAGLIALGLHHYPKTVLFIDIGTNGEIVVCKDGAFVGTSSAAGPALEGMNITCGCRAEQGAVEGVAILNDDTLKVEIIGNSDARGICGSGLIDLVAELVRCGVIEASGRFAKEEKLSPVLASRLINTNGKLAFSVTEEGTVFLSQKDVRQVQLAKGAIAAAIDLLLKELNIDYADIEEVFVAGAFGFHLKPASLVGIGLLPLVCKDKIRFVGNTAKEGAKAVLLNRQAGLEIVEIAKKIQIKELSLHPKFQDYYIKALSFPAI